MRYLPVVMSLACASVLTAQAQVDLVDSPLSSTKIKVLQEKNVDVQEPSISTKVSSSSSSMGIVGQQPPPSSQSQSSILGPNSSISSTSSVSSQSSSVQPFESSSSSVVSVGSSAGYSDVYFYVCEFDPTDSSKCFLMFPGLDTIIVHSAGVSDFSYVSKSSEFTSFSYGSGKITFGEATASASETAIKMANATWDVGFYYILQSDENKGIGGGSMYWLITEDLSIYMEHESGCMGSGDSTCTGATMITDKTGCMDTENAIFYFDSDCPSDSCDGTVNPITGDCETENSSSSESSSVSSVLACSYPYQDVTFTVTDTKQDECYNASGTAITCPSSSQSYYGQDAQYSGVDTKFATDCDDTVVIDQQTGLVWQKTPDNELYQYDEAITYCENLTTGGLTDWRLPTIKELFSIADFRGEIVVTFQRDADSTSNSTPYIDTTAFDFEYATTNGYLAQYWSITKYDSPLQNAEVEGAFGFNFGDGHIKGYETGYYYNGGLGVQAPGNYVRCVSGKEDVYGVNNFSDNGDTTITDNATGLMWEKNDDGAGMNWQKALDYCESSSTAGYSDWRLPDIKELQSIVEYGKSTRPALDTDYFNYTSADTTSDANWFWSSTSHGDTKTYAAYIAFGKAYSKENSSATTYYDWHGAGAQRSDPKSGQPSDYDLSSENATDLVQIDNYVRCVRDADATASNAANY